jgi:hypothetical protein
MRTLNEQDSSSWPTLDHVAGTVPEVYNLALTSRIRELEFFSILHGMDPGMLEEFLNIMQCTTPWALTFRAKQGVLNESFYLRFVERTRGLQYLELEFYDHTGSQIDKLVSMAIPVVVGKQIILLRQ